MDIKESLTKTRTIQLRYKNIHILIFSLLLLLVTYLCWEIYWYNKSGLAFIKWHTHIFFTALLTGIFWLPFYLFHRFYPTKTAQNALLSATSIAVTLILLEVLLVITGLNKGYMEKRWGYYQSPYKNDTNNFYFVPQPYYLNTNKSPEYTYLIPHNALGFPDKDWSDNSETDSLRILTLGDSFTEGDGVCADSSYPAILEKHLRTRYPLANVMNAGIMGSDPFYNYINLSKRLLRYKPDIVLQTISTQDIYLDWGIRGGFERFSSDSTVHYKKAPVWEPVIAASYVARIFLSIAGFNISEPSGNKADKSMIADKNALLMNLIHHYDSLAVSNNFKLVYILLPAKDDMKNKTFDFDFSNFIAGVNKTYNSRVFSLLPAYENYLSQKGANYKDAYWIIDGHHNSTGYNMMAVCIEQYLNNNLLDTITAYKSDTKPQAVSKPQTDK